MKEVSAISTDLIKACRIGFRSDSTARIVRNAITKTSVADVALNRDVISSIDFVFSHPVKTGAITDQKASGRCWLFAGLNTMRTRAMKKMNLENFELSQSYCFFWDKFEKSNFFLENIIKTVDEAIDSRLVMWLLSVPLNDGGQWDMFANLIKRYGVVPKSVMPESFNSSNSHQLNYLLTLKLREYALLLRTMKTKGVNITDMRKQKNDMLKEVYKMLATFMGEPPETFSWQYRDKSNKFHRELKPMTPLTFFKKYVNFNMGEMVSLINCPTKNKPFNKVYTFQYLGNTAGGEPIKYLNVPIDYLKKVTAEIVSKGQPVWFGCDVGKMLYREGGVMHKTMFEYDRLFGTSFGMDKAQRVDYGESQMTHAMVITGVDLVNKKPTKWMVENSWGDKHGEKGFFVMDDDWFDEYLYQVVVPKKSLTQALSNILKQKPFVLEPWDPMGSLAMMQ